MNECASTIDHQANVLRTEISFQFYLRDTANGLDSHSANASAGIRDPLQFNAETIADTVTRRIRTIQSFRSWTHRFLPADSVELEYQAITQLPPLLNELNPLLSSVGDTPFVGGNPQCNALMAFLDEA
jgi:hypothetical protein